MKGFGCRFAAFAAIAMLAFAALFPSLALADAVEIRQRRGIVFPRVTRTREVPIRSAAPLAIQVPGSLAIAVPHGCVQPLAIRTSNRAIILRR